MTQRQFDAEEFLKLFKEKINQTPSCRYCGHRDYTISGDVMQIIAQKSIDGLMLGPTLPTAAIIYQHCGHIDFFSLGAYGLLNTKEETSDGN